MNEYSLQMTQTECTKIIHDVRSAEKKSEPALASMENKKLEKGKCRKCGCTRCKMKKCWYYDSTVTLEVNKKTTELIKETLLKCTKEQ